MALYLGYLALLLLGLLSITIGIGLSMVGDGLCAFVNWLAAWYALGPRLPCAPLPALWPMAGLCRLAGSCWPLCRRHRRSGLPLNRCCGLPLQAPCVMPAAGRIGLSSAASGQPSRLATLTRNPTAFGDSLPRPSVTAFETTCGPNP